MPSRAPGENLGARWFGRLGRAIVRHPWYPVAFWVGLLLVAAPFLSHVGEVTTNSATNLPASAPSSVAATKIAELFPNSTGGSNSILLFTGKNILGPTGQATVIAVGNAIAADPGLNYLSGVTSVYSEYGGYLQGQAELALGVVAAGTLVHPSTPDLVNQSAGALWGPVSTYFTAWRAYGATHPSEAPELWNYPAFNSTRAALSGNSTANAVLGAFYNGVGSSSAGFNGSAACALDLSSVQNCTDATARANLPPLLPSLGLSPSVLGVAGETLAALGVENYTAWPSVQYAAATVWASASGLTPAFIALTWSDFPSLHPSAAELAAWAERVVVGGSPATYPVPIPPSISSQFVSADGAAEIVLVGYSVGDGYTTPTGATPVYDDVARIGALVPPILAAHDPSHAITFYQTGAAPLDQNENTVLTQSLAIVLPLTIVVLIAITMLYFRAPLAPLLTFGGLGIALGLGVGAVVLVGTVVTHVDVTAIELEETFVLGVGTDYSIFLVARYREELYGGAEPKEAVVRSVSWAGQSVATSGATAILATAALAFSGVALLSQWGIVLSLAILITVLLSLTLVPAFLTLLGPRVFWPRTGARFRRHAEAVRAAEVAERTYFHRAGRFAQRHRFAVLGLVALASVPLLYVALTVPLSYDFYQQLPASQPAIEGLDQLGAHFGSGYGFPINVLATFAAPLREGAGVNASELSDLAALTSLYANTSGVYAVSSPVGPTGAPLSEWLNLSHLPTAPAQDLRNLLASYLGTDGRSVVLTVVPSSSGLSYDAVTMLGRLQAESSAFATTHPMLSATYFAGGAPVTRDLEQQTALATERMVLLVALGLIVVLFLALRSWVIPLLAVASIGLSLGWAWSTTYLALDRGLGVPLFFFVPTILFIIILGLGIDYNIFLLTRVREERLKGRTSTGAAVAAVAATGGIITAAAVILASAFAVLAVGQFLLLRAIGFSVAVAVLLDAMVVRTYLVPAALHALGDRAYRLYPFQRGPPPPAVAEPAPAPREPAPPG